MTWVQVLTLPFTILGLLPSLSVPQLLRVYTGGKLVPTSWSFEDYLAHGKCSGSVRQHYCPAESKYYTHFTLSLILRC